MNKTNKTVLIILGIAFVLILGAFFYYKSTILKDDAEELEPEEEEEPEPEPVIKSVPAPDPEPEPETNNTFDDGEKI